MSLFGRPAAPAFGTSAGQPAPTTSLFGQTMNQPQAQTQPQSSAFGTSLLGQPAPQQQPQQQQQPVASSFLGASQAALQNKSLIWEPGRESISHKPVTEQMETIVGKWSANNPNTVFKHYFYNNVGQARVPFFQPGPGEDPREWEQAAHDKPDAGYVPVLATGFAAIGERLKMQEKALAQYRQTLHSINACLDAILSHQDLQTSVRALTARRKHAILRQRCLALATRVQVLRNRGYSLDKDEDELKSKLETLDQGLMDPAVSARTEELWSRLLVLRGYADTLRKEIERRGPETQEGLGEEAEAKAKKVTAIETPTKSLL
ncbi:nucleoporin complex subunit 54-domain-containing protein [Xylaria bambusicola]|uniref:nucleoporin complex subunit 54-domain-containing protein n=1 Tax=Xylaria bambusicola TaxID=326684 RepID=UPI0020082E8A|nr:nucleoporin complex subunit 54-domain-containing protein [Xylaria bambusicola]KAI0521047.1 nucleoporin complex subunit 54-domain-containing protein [Xylaria bambusicola]